MTVYCRCGHARASHGIAREGGVGCSGDPACTCTWFEPPEESRGEPWREAKPGSRAARPRYPSGPEHAGTVDEVERLRRKLDMARWERDRWRRRCLVARGRVARLERRRAWAEAYLGFRLEYRLRGLLRRWRRWRRAAWRKAGAFA